MNNYTIIVSTINTELQVIYHVEGGDYNGFDTFEQAQSFANEYKGEVCLFKKRDGQHWVYVGQVTNSLTAGDYLQALGDNYYSVTQDSEIDSWKESIINVVKEFDGDFTTLENTIARIKKVQLALENAGDDQVVIVGDGGHYVEIVDEQMMSYHHDVTSYCIGVRVAEIEQED